MKKLPIIDLPEVFSLNSKYEYYEYSSDESLIANQRKRKILISGTTAIDPFVPPQVEFSSELSGARDFYNIPENTDSLKNGSNMEAGVSSGDITSFKKSFNESIKRFKKVIKESSETEADAGAIFRERTRWMFFDTSGETNLSGYIDNKFVGDATYGSLNQVQEEAIENYSRERETIWRIISSSSGDKTIYRLGIFLSIERKSLWGQEIIENEEKVIFFDNLTPSTWTFSLDALHGWEYKISVKNMFLINIFDQEGENPAYAILMSRRRTTKVETFFYDRPLNVSDVRGVWDFNRDCLLLQWSYPLDKLNIIKKIQIFRRKDLDSSYRLVREFNWNDNQIEWAREQNELVPRQLISNKIPPNYWYDKDFEPRAGSLWHYTICTITTHGTSSDYSMQTTVRWVDSQKGVSNSLLSRSGAPKAYPNKLLETRAATREGITSNTIQIKDSEKITIYLNPEAKEIRNNANITLLDFTKKGWAFNFINHENLENFQTILKTTETEPESIRRENTDTGE